MGTERRARRRTLAIMAVLATAWLSGSGCRNSRAEEARAAWNLSGGGNAQNGPALLRGYGCDTCHTISALPEARGLVGPSLDGVSQRLYLAGELPNSPENLVRWIQHPHEVEPKTVMPEMGVSEQDSRDIAAFLYTLRDTNQRSILAF